MRVLVTGGAGFIGSHVADKLIYAGHDVAIIDNISTGRKQNINKKAKFYHVDLTSDKLIDVFEDFKPQWVNHHAAHIKVRDSVTKPIYDADNNIGASIKLLECCRKFDVKRVVYASSGGAIYGDPIKLPCDESHPIAPVSQYGCSKFGVELMLNFYQEAYGIKCCSLRYANVYGSRQDPLGEAGVISIFIGRLFNGKKCIIFGDGNQTRDFVYVGDVAEANLLAFEKQGPFNIGTGVETSVNELFNKIQKYANSDVGCIHGDAVKGEVNRIFLAIDNAKETLNWQPKVGIDEGLKKTVEWFKHENID